MLTRQALLLIAALLLLPVSGSAAERVPAMAIATAGLQGSWKLAATSVVNINPRDPTIKLKLEACLLAGDVSCVVAQWMLLHGYKDPPKWLASFQNAFALANRKAGECIKVARSIHEGLSRLGQAPQFMKITVKGPRPLLGFDEVVNGQITKTYQLSTNGLHWAVRLNGKILDAYTGLAGLPEEEYLQRLQPYPGTQVFVEFLDELL